MYFFIGIKGTGMAALACMLYDLGLEVAGSDLAKHFFTEDELVKRGIKIYPFSEDNIKEGQTVIIGNAFLDDFPEVKKAQNMANVTCYRYHQFVGKLMEKYQTIAICGSHGKTTTTTMVKDVFSQFYDTGYLIGDGEGKLKENDRFLCVEADEFERHFLAYKPKYAIITNIEIDHVDYFKDEKDYRLAYQEFVNQVQEAVFYNGDDYQCRMLNYPQTAFSFGFNKDNDFYISDFVQDGLACNFNLYFRDNFVANYNLPFSEKHYLYDSLGTIALATTLCLQKEGIENAFQHFVTPKRRFKVEEIGANIFIDDYAHHPTEVRVTLETAKHRYPNHEIVAIFKPHRASRVLHFASDFVESLSLADSIYLLDFTSIDDKQDGTDIDITYLANKLKGSCVLKENEEGAKILAKHKHACFVFMSSKDIYPLAEKVKKIINSY